MIRVAVSALMVVLACASARAQTVIAAWNFNSNSFTASTGSGTMSLIGGTTSVFNTGSPNDPGPNNQGPNTTSYRAQGVGSGTAGVEFALSTVGFQSIRFGFDQRHSNTSSRYVRVDYSVNHGANYIQGPVFAALDGDTWHTREADLTGVAGAGDNPDLRVRIVAVFDPNLTNQYSASRVTSTYASTGTLRPDLVTVTGTAVVSVPPQVAGSFSPVAVCRGGTSTLTVNAAPGQNPPSQSLELTANLTSLGGGGAVPLVLQSGTTYALVVNVGAGAAQGVQNIPVKIKDDLQRESTSQIALAVGDCGTDSGKAVVISMVYGGAGSAGSLFNADFVELHNRSCGPVNLGGWALQYTGAGGANQFDGTRQVNLSGVIAPGGYLLVQTSRPAQGDPGLPLPPADLLAFPANPDDPPVPPQTQDGFGMDNSNGRVALTTSTAPILGDCAAASVADLVGYGAGAFCYEGAAPTATTSNTTLATRKSAGCVDANQNFNDFDVVTPIDDPRTSASPPLLCQTCTPGGCNAADITEIGGTSEDPGTPDGQLTVDDIIVFINMFSDGTGCPGAAPCSAADVTGIGGLPEAPDGQLTVDDIIAFFNSFSDGCV